MSARLVIGWDPSTEGAAWACLRVERGRRVFVACGECADEAAIQDELRTWQAEKPIVGVEVPQGIHTNKNDAKAARARGMQLMKTRGVAATVATSARMLGLDVLELSPERCRSQVGLKRSPPDAAVKSVLRALVPNWPEVSNNHVRDAGVCALATALRWDWHVAKKRAEANRRTA